MTPVLACHDLPGWNTGNCCISCHEDWEGEYGMDMMEVYEGDQLRWHLCCAAWLFWDADWEGS